MGMKLTIYSENETNNICLTNHTIKKYGKNSEEPDGKNEYLSEPILGIEFSGKVDVYDKSGEILELKKLAQWAKKTAHEKDVYRKVVIEFNDISGNEYDSVTLEKAFVVRYEQSFDGEKGEGEFYILLRSLDHMDDVFGQAWDSTAWNIDDVTVKAGDTTNIKFASNPVNTEYTILAQTAEEYQKYIDGLSPDELLNEFRTLSLVGIDVTSMLGILDTKTKMDMVWNKLHNREQNKDLKKSPTSASNELISFLKSYEKFYDKPYRGQDTQNRTVGYGHVITSNDSSKYDNGITEFEATELLKNDLEIVVYQYLNSWIKNNSIILTQQQYDALVSFTFNTGPNWLTIYENLRNILISGSVTYDSMYNEFMTWIKVNDEYSLGIYRRRMDELDIFFYGDYTRDYPDEPDWF